MMYDACTYNQCISFVGFLIHTSGPSAVATCQFNGADVPIFLDMIRLVTFFIDLRAIFISHDLSAMRCLNKEHISLVFFLETTTFLPLFCVQSIYVPTET